MERLDADIQALIDAGDDLMLRRIAPGQAEEMNELAGAGDLIPDLPRTDAPENKVLTNADCVRSMSDEKLAEMIYDISTNMCCNTVCPKPIHRSNECKPGQVYNCKNRILAWLRRKPEGSACDV